MSYLLDQPMYYRDTDTYYPEPGTHGYVEYNDDEGRAEYKNTYYLIQYLQALCEECGNNCGEIPGVVFSVVIPWNYDPVEGRFITESESEESD